MAVLDHHEHVEAAQENGVDVGEVDGEDYLGLRGQELVRFQNSAMASDLRLYAVISYALWVPETPQTSCDLLVILE